MSTTKPNLKSTKLSRKRYHTGPTPFRVIASDDFLDVTLTHRHQLIYLLHHTYFANKPNL
jgi:stress-induced morphogen